MKNLSARRVHTSTRTAELRELLVPAAKIVTGSACVYATGSYGRNEASTYSDLDLFIVSKRKGNIGTIEEGESKLKRLDGIRVMADLIEATRRLGLPDFDNDGKYLTHHPVHSLTKTLGKPEDDAENTFTARLLLLLESSPLLESVVYNEIIEDVISEYWGDYEDHKTDFVPGYLANDILRLWRTFCVNYEAGTSRSPEIKKAKRKIKNYKLKHSRLLTCYSALIYLLVIYQREGTVSPTNALAMTQLTPTQRLEWLLEQSDTKPAHEPITKLLKQYDEFLGKTDYPEPELVDIFLDRKKSGDYMKEAYDFGDTMFEAISSIGNGKRFHRLIIV
ncbi:Polymerase nucleotidyl transferase domain-containing protein [Methylorubrum aminovorans]